MHACVCEKASGRETDGCFDFNVIAFFPMQKKQTEQNKERCRQTDRQPAQERQLGSGRSLLEPAKRSGHHVNPPEGHCWACNCP